MTTATQSTRRSSCLCGRGSNRRTPYSPDTQSSGGLLGFRARIQRLTSVAWECWGWKICCKYHQQKLQITVIIIVALSALTQRSFSKSPFYRLKTILPCFTQTMPSLHCQRSADSLWIDLSDWNLYRLYEYFMMHAFSIWWLHLVCNFVVAFVYVKGPYIC